MALASSASPRSLYSLAVDAVAATYTDFSARESKGLPNNVFLDIISSLHANGQTLCLQRELSSLSTIEKLLRCKGERRQLHYCFEQLGIEKDRVASKLTETFAAYSEKLREVAAFGALTPKLRRTFELGRSLAAFLTDVGSLLHAELVYKYSHTLLKSCQDEKLPHVALLSLDCRKRLLRVHTIDRNFPAAEAHLDLTLKQTEQLELEGTAVNKADLYTAAAELFFARHLYDKAFEYSRQALQELDCSVPVKVVVDTLRLCAVTSVVKRDLTTAAVFAKQAVKLAKETLGENHPCYSDALLDYAYYLLNADLTEQAVIVYEEAVKKRELAYGACSFMAAFCYEDLAYALYLKEYSSGEFTKARELIGDAMRIYGSILPKNHILLASSKRVKALILEEIALDREDADVAAKLLEQAWQLHIDALCLAVKAFGEDNVQTAKHYGNLGRLYQSFGQFEKARELHLKAIDIKERVLGKEDYEVALSVGHLASLYNYDMELHDEAEELYMRSVSIGLKLFGPVYSGLEYDYRGLIWLYTAKCEHRMADHYKALLDEWSTMRMQKQETATDTFQFLHDEDAETSSPTTTAGALCPVAAAAAAAAGGASMQGAGHSCSLPLCSTVLPRLRAAAVARQQPFSASGSFLVVLRL